jgi:hypothetical protein
VPPANAGAHFLKTRPTLPDSYKKQDGAGNHKERGYQDHDRAIDWRHDLIRQPQH